MDQIQLRALLRSSVIRILALGLGLIFSNGASAVVVAEMSQVGDTAHLEFKGSNHWEYNINKEGSKISIEVPRLSEATVESLQKSKSGDIQVQSVRHEGSGGNDLIVLKLKNSNMEVFDYLTDQPSRLIIDFFAKPKGKNQTPAQVADSPVNPSEGSKTKAIASKKLGAQVRPVVSKAKVSDRMENSTQRKPATTDRLTIASENLPDPTASVADSARPNSGIFDGGDPGFDRFQIKDYEIQEEAQVVADSRYYVDYPMLKETGVQLQKIKVTEPLYEIEPKDNDENKQARLLLTLFENRRYNVFLKTVNWFYEKYPKSEYDEIVRFMWADTHYALWNQDHDVKDFDLAMLRYRQALEKYPQSPLVERTQMLMGFSSMDRGDYLGTLRLFQKHILSRPQSPNRDIARLAIAENFSQLAQYDEALKLYEEIDAQASSPKYQIEAAFLKGDVEYQRKEIEKQKDPNHSHYAKAIELYKEAIRKYPNEAKNYPNVYFNQAAALFLEKHPRESLDVFLDFLKLFPTHEHAPYAMTRVGEILDSLGADKSKVMGAYLETYFRYGDSPGAVVARLRLLSSRMNGMKAKELEKAISDMQELAKGSSLPKIEQFATLLVADGLASRKDFERSIELLTKYYQKNPTTADTQLLTKKIVANITAEIKYLGDNQKFLEALKIHEKYSDNWLKDTHRIDNTYEVAKNFDRAGVPAQSYKLYKQALNQILALKGTPQEKRVTLEQHLPSTDTVILQLAQSSFRLGKDSEAYENLRQIKNPEALSEAEQIDRVQLASQLLEKKGDLPSAQRYLVELVKTWHGIAKLMAPPYLRIGELQEKQNQKAEALKSYQKVAELNEDSKDQVPPLVLEKALERIGEIYSELKQPEQAAEAYAKLLNQFESKVPLASFRYKMGKIFFDRGDLVKANETWAPLKESKNPIWYGLASEQMKDSNWSGEYKKYIQRIPAMARDPNAPKPQ